VELLNDPVIFDERSLSDHQEGLLTKEVPGQPSREDFRTGAPDGRPSEGFKQLVRLIFDGGEELEMDRVVPGVQPVLWDDDRYSTTDWVAVE